MCGIAGVLSFKGIVEQDILVRMAAPLRPRGPDGGNYFIHNQIGLAHRRLSIIDLSEQASQPMKDLSTGNILVFNGTIYNYRQLRSELATEYTFTSQSDSEVILKAYAKWGNDCVNHLTGMFAFAIWDVTKQSLFIARDRIGIKPLYIAHNTEGFYFASTLQSILASGKVDRTLDPYALNFLYTLHAVVPAPYTLIKAIRKLPPAHWMQIQLNGEVKSHCYWQLDATRDATPYTVKDWQEKTENILNASVQSHCEVADVPVGILLSGGLDSSLLVALADELGQRPLHTFSIGFEDQPEEKGNEFEFSDQIVARYATQHQKILIPNQEVLHRLPEAIAQMSEPVFAQDAVAFYLLSEQVAKSVKVVLSGQGADEVFAGYFWYELMHESKESDPLKRFSQYYFDRDYAEYCELIRPEWQIGDVAGDFVRQALTQPKASEYIDQVLRLDVTALIVDDPVKRVDNMTMAHGLEARVPFLDHHVVELAARMPPELKLSQNGKGILKQISRGRMPDGVIDRPKAYFPMPALKYVRGEFYDMMRAALTNQAARNRGIFQAEYVNALLENPEAPESFTRIQGSKLWHCALLELWLQQHIDK